MWEKWHQTHETWYDTSWENGRIIEDWTVKYVLYLHNNGEPTRKANNHLRAVDLTFSVRIDPDRIKWISDSKNTLCQTKELVGSLVRLVT